MAQDGPEQFDVVVIGAGFSGLYAIHRLRQQHSVVCFETGDGVGGTWYWNRYPGARVDIISVEYSYGFDEALQQEWRWPEYFSAQPALEDYANHVADRFDLRKHIRFSNPVTRMRFDGKTNRWHVHTANGDHVEARWVIAATGALHAPNEPAWPGRELFKGQVLHTTQWPREGMDLTGKRVALIGTGSTGVQATPIIAEQAAHLHLFQRTPAYSMPSGNRPLDPEFEAEWKANYAERRQQMLHTWGVSLIDYPTYCVADCTPEQQNEILEAAWHSKNAFQLMVAFADVMVNPAANAVVAEFARNKIRSIVKDPKTAELLCPTYPIGAKRLGNDKGYYESFNRDNVTLVDAKSAPIVAFTEKGLRTTDAEYEFDVIILATGFDAVTGAMSRIAIEGPDGQTVTEKWSEGPTTYLGAMIAGFPNLFMIHGPLTPGAQAQMITAGEWQVNWTADIIEDLESRGVARIETTPEAEQWWAQQVNAAAAMTVHNLADSWYNAKNIEGKKGGFMIYVGGFPEYTRACTEAVAGGYRGFVLTPEPATAPA
ncbi:NAD(P)/FAD-dependent oxidoreductase [Novosphingobium sp.]|uniref:flavin-containing monooxygenase n=1 Tax=Novosphingobium sp. TaxID=1874826 RepID=UPI0026346AB8|nr:NAD(P)/FAD-dependent oxidoreductase [Novosphingobium sp.]